MNDRVIRNIMNEAATLHETLRQDEKLISKIARAAEEIVMSFRNGNKVLLCGNGGSAADAQHIAAELSGKFLINRDPLYAEALHVNTSYLTATANDYSFDAVYSRLVRSKGAKGDILIGISTSGKSPNVVNALSEGRKKGMITIGMSGSRKANMDAYCDILIGVPTEATPRIQELHILIGHIICELVESELFG